MNRYDRYKDSGIPWLGEVPVHWDVKRLKFLARIQNGADYKHVETNDGYPVIGSGGQFAYANSYLYDGESVLLGRKGTIDRPLYVIGKFWTVDTMYYTEILKNTYPKYFYYLTLTIDFGRYSTQTALPSMTQTALNNLVFAVPHYEEQTTIAHYLDTKLGEIDALIDKQQTLLEKLAEQRTAVITHAVTKGLNPAAPMKNSGVEWLGDVPAHWDVKRLRFLCNIITGDMDTQDNEPNGQYPFYVRSEVVERSNEYSFDNEAVLMAGDGVGAGKVFHYVNGKYGCHQRVYSLSNFKQISGKFLYFYLKEFFKRKIEEGGAKSTVDSVRLPMLKDFAVCLPNDFEQIEIVSYINEETAKIDRLCETVNQTIGRLKEYRTALITQAVTGKIKVTDE